MATTEITQKGMASTLSPLRIIVDVVLSANFYLFYWVYLTWKQLKVQTGRNYHPVWHALALLVPIYNLFIFWRHVQTIKALQEEADLKPFIRTGWIFTLWIIGAVIDFQSGRFAEVGVGAEAFVVIIAAAFIAGAFVRAQRGLNAYWVHIGGETAKNARVGVGEVIFVILGLLYWASLFLL